MPVVFCKVHDDGDKHGECLVFVLFQNVEEVVVLKEAHGAVCHLQVIAADRAHDSLEEALNERLYLFDFADFKNLLQLRQEEGLLHAVGKWPVLKQTFKEGNGKGTVLSQEEHRAAEQLLVELTASLYFVQRNDNVLKEDNVLVTEGHGKSRDDTCLDVQKFCCSVELVRLVNKRIEALIDGLANHLASWHQLANIKGNRLDRHAFHSLCYT